VSDLCNFFASEVLAAWVRGTCIRFAILFRELPVDRHEELIRRAMRWPDPLADQIVRERVGSGK
jgi:hypothetical protein